MKFMGILLVLVGIVLALYVGIYLCFVGGIISIVEFVRHSQTAPASLLAWGILKILFANAVGCIVALLLIVPGIALLAD